MLKVSSFHTVPPSGPVSQCCLLSSFHTVPPSGPVSQCCLLPSFHTVPPSGPVSQCCLLSATTSSSPSGAVLSGAQLSFTAARIREPPRPCQATDGGAIAVYDGIIAYAALPLLNIACHVPSAPSPILLLPTHITFQQHTLTLILLMWRI